MCAALKRGPYFEKELPSICEMSALSEHECARCENHTLKAARPQFMKLLHVFKMRVRGAQARATVWKRAAL
eukprot:7956226-Pyramimonas_sp.AAC.1